MFFIPNDLIANKTAFVQIIAWRRSGDKPLSEAVMAKFIKAYICVSRPSRNLDITVLGEDCLCNRIQILGTHYNDVIMSAIASHITSLTIVYSIVYSDADQRKHQSSASLAFVRGIPRGPVNSPHKWPVTRKMFPFDDVIMPKHKTSASLSTYSGQYGINTLPLSTLNVRGPSYLGLTRSISWLLMPWLLASPGHQQPWY